MYCVKCGVELDDAEERCPLCGTRVYHPDIERGEGEPLFPRTAESEVQTVSRGGALFIITSIFALAVLLPLVCNLSINRAVTWSGFVTGAVLLAYIVIVLPLWFKKPNPVIFVPCDFAAAAVYLLYIDLAVHGGWFMTFALPITGGAALITTAAVTLCRCLRRGYLYIFGGVVILSGGFAVLVESMLTLTFGEHMRIGWSLYPLAACTLIGLWLLIVAICPNLRDSLKKKFFV